MRKSFYVIVICTFAFMLLCGCQNPTKAKRKIIMEDVKVVSVNEPIKYDNIQYGFTFTLPESWSGYKILTNRWEGLSLGQQNGEKIVETGPLIIIRHPQWTMENPRLDIPIMVFTQKQWTSLQKDEFHIGAAPIGPSKLGENKDYVFALPARYNFSFLPGYEEVENILKGNPLKATENTSSY
ncbi:hypothetical protein JK636_00230 [Clostridium sp. YIM B02515]|uniref:Uncharacterized protein n=1 Tax=Clostridium rhizosphaerae TaxID=2803861 RepID=A0ABS1T615_9CLOT|nr:hypothetical protein [Clostridium rhizosphaerae]MBL4934177.1 hypothetical protein [Clostridium rhizosphaerae]